MSDKEKIITQEDILDFVSEVFVKNECPWCTNRHWALEKTDPSKKIASFIFLCISCGYTRTHAKEAVANWKEKKSIEKRTIWLNVPDVDRDNDIIETPILTDLVKSYSEIHEGVARCRIEMKDGEIIDVIERLEEIKQKISARGKFYE